MEVKAACNVKKDLSESGPQCYQPHQSLPYIRILSIKNPFLRADPEKLGIQPALHLSQLQDEYALQLSQTCSYKKWVSFREYSKAFRTFHIAGWEIWIPELNLFFFFFQSETTEASLRQNRHHKTNSSCLVTLEATWSSHYLCVYQNTPRHHTATHHFLPVFD